MMQPQPRPQSDVLHTYLLGHVEFEAALALQKRLVYQVSGDPLGPALLICEHGPLITVGRQGSWAHIRDDIEVLQDGRIRVRWVNRGGGCLLHLPGQLAIYPILSLTHAGLGLSDYLDRLHSVLIATLDDFGVIGRTRPGHAGVWVGDRLVAAVGVAVRDWVTYFGAALNLNPDLAPFRAVRCGLPNDGPMTSLERERRGPVRPALVRERLLDHFADRFEFTDTVLFTEHPSLRRKAFTDAVASRP